MIEVIQLIAMTYCFYKFFYQPYFNKDVGELNGKIVRRLK